MIRVKFFVNSNVRTLENEIPEFVKSYKISRKQIIKFYSSLLRDPALGLLYFAVIMYEDGERKK